MGHWTNKETPGAHISKHAIQLSKPAMARPNGASEMTWHPVEKYITLPLLVAVVVALVAGVL
jgi:hypothetical protein